MFLSRPVAFPISSYRNTEREIVEAKDCAAFDKRFKRRDNSKSLSTRFRCKDYIKGSFYNLKAE
jgi:hypothetical protein